MTTKFLNISTDNKFTENSNILVPSQKATKEYIASKILQVDFIQDTEPTSFIANQLWLNTNDNKIYKAITDSNWDSGNLAQKDQLFSNNSLLYYYDGSDIKEYSSQTITEQNNNIKLKTWVGTQSEYDAIVTKDQNTEYIITDAYTDYDLILATQTEFNNSSTIKAATPYQVNQKIGNYLPLAGGNLNAGAILRLTNTNNEVTSLAFNTSGYLTVGSKLYINTETNTNTVVVRSGNIYKVNTSGATALWSDMVGVASGLSTLDSNVKVPSTQLPLATSSTIGVVKPDGNTITVDSNGVITAIGGGGSTDIDNSSITLNDSDEIQAVGLVEQRANTTIKEWVGTKAQYDSIATKDADTIYNITDDVASTTSLLEALYPVGSIYISTNATCPLSTLISGSSWVLVSSGRVLQGADLDHVAGTTIEAGLPNITGDPTYGDDNSSDVLIRAWNPTGCFVAKEAPHTINSNGTAAAANTAVFDASASNPIYGNSDTVQPPAYVVNIFRRTA